MAFLLLYPIILMVIIGIPVLLLWANKGLSLKNLFILVFGGTLGIGLAGIIAFSLHETENIHPYFLMSLFVILPPLGAIVLLKKSKSKGISVTKPTAMLFSQPLLVLKAYVFSHIIGLSISTILIALIYNLVTYDQKIGDAINLQIFMTMIKIPVSLIATLLITSFMSKKLALIFALLFGAISSLILFSLLFIAIPVVAYATITPYLLVYIMYLGHADKKAHN